MANSHPTIAVSIMAHFAPGVDVGAVRKYLAKAAVWRERVRVAFGLVDDALVKRHAKVFVVLCGGNQLHDWTKQVPVALLQTMLAISRADARTLWRSFGVNATAG